jgi:hypothetical protein
LSWTCGGQSASASWVVAGSIGMYHSTQLMILAARVYVFSWDRVLLCSSSHPQTSSPPASASKVLEL